MGEQKLREMGNRDEPVKLSTHIVETVNVNLPPDTGTLGGHIEDAYQAVAMRAKSEDSFILNVVQTVNVYQVLDVERNIFKCRALVTITAQRVSRAELEQQQLRQRMGMK